MLLIVYSSCKETYPFWHMNLSEEFKKDLDKVCNRTKPSILVIKEGILL